jgi:hypothetical protein
MNVYRAKHLKLLSAALLVLVFLKVFFYDSSISTGHEPNPSDVVVHPSPEEPVKPDEAPKPAEKKPAPKEELLPLIPLFVSNVQNEQYQRYISLNKRRGRDFKTFEAKSSPSRKMNKEQYFLIVEYTKIFSRPKFCELNIIKDMYAKSNIYEKLINEKKPDAANYQLLEKCAFRNCLFSCDKSLSEHADALLFHDTDLKTEISHAVRNLKDLGRLSKFMSEFVRFRRDPNQVWIFWNDETNYVEPAVDMLNFNYTISYNSMGEVSYGAYGTYGALSKKLTEEQFMEMVKKEFDLRKQGNGSLL